MKKLKVILFIILITSISMVGRTQIPILVNEEGFLPELCGMNQLTSFKGELYFEAHQCDYKSQLYKTDGTEQGTGMLKEIVCDCGGWIGSQPENLIVINDQMFFSQYDSTNTLKELWVTDGTYQGTRIVRRFNTQNWQGMKYPVKFNNMLFFIIDTDEHGYELWKSDGSGEGTVLVKDIFAGTEGSFPRNFMVLNNELFFFANDGEHGSELWKTDGTESGTVMVKDISPGSGSSDYNIEEKYITYSGNLIFSANDGIHGAELWMSDGTNEGSTMIKDLNEGENSSRPANFVVFNDIVYFTAADYSHLDRITQPLDFYNAEFFRTDGTEEGTFLVKDINQDSQLGSHINHLNVCNNTMLFTATTSPYSYSGELYKSDGTSEGTLIVKAFSDVFVSYSSAYLSTGSIFLFRANDPEHGSELWKSSGSENTTSLIYDLEPGYAGSYPSWLTAVDNVLYFTTSTDCDKLWKMDGLNNLTISENYEPDISVYPTPFRDFIHVECPNFSGKEAVIRIYDHLGKSVYQKAFDNSADIFINGLKYLDAGLYMIEISIHNFHGSKKIIKSN